MKNTQKLQAYLLVCGYNLSILHRHIVGANWVSNHEQLEQYAWMINNFTDEVIEMALSVNEKEISITNAINMYEVLDTGKRYDEETAFKLVKEWFNDIYDLIEDAKKDKNLLKCQISKLEETQEKIKLEKDYKLEKRLEDE